MDLTGFSGNAGLGQPYYVLLNSNMCHTLLLLIPTVQTPEITVLNETPLLRSSVLTLSVVYKSHKPLSINAPVKFFSFSNLQT